MSRPGLVVDLFAGGGGASVGIAAALGREPDIAIDHSPVALAVHRANHPETRHLVSDVWEVDPVEATGGRPVDLLWASPDCTHFSIARGGKPNRSKKIRSLAWVVVRWAKAVQPRMILLENVREFQTWGPLDEGGRVIPHLKGRTFKSWAGRLRGLGYAVEWRILNAADYGAPTSRRRLFLIARRDGKPIRWPEKTHGPTEPGSLPFGALLPYRTAAECIDWSIPCPSIFTRKKPLAAKTLWRIANGIKRFVLDAPRPFVVRCDMPRANGDLVHPIEEPLRTIHTGGAHAVVSPLLAVTGYGESASQGPRVEPIDAPVPTVTGSGLRRGLVAPTIVPIQNFGWGDSTRPADEPSRTITAGPKGGGQALCAAFLARHFGGVVGAPLDGSVPTVTAKDHHSLAAASLVKLRGQCSGADPAEPMPTVTGQGLHVAEVRAFLCAYYVNDAAGQALTDPARTLTTKDRLGLVTVEGQDYQIVDIGMRMLEPAELLRAQFGTFAAGYDLSAARTKAAKVRLIGNSVCPNVVQALVAANAPSPAAGKGE